MWSGATLAVAGYGLVHSTFQLALVCLLFNALEAAGTVVWATIKQHHVPGELLGRVSSLDWLISIGLLPVSYALTAPVVALVGLRATLVGASLIGRPRPPRALLLRNAANRGRIRLGRIPAVCSATRHGLVVLLRGASRGREGDEDEEADDGTRTHDLLHGKQTL